VLDRSGGIGNGEHKEHRQRVGEKREHGFDSVKVHHLRLSARVCGSGSKI
jgi:hypothetical protein